MKRTAFVLAVGIGVAGMAWLSGSGDARALEIPGIPPPPPAGVPPEAKKNEEPPVRTRTVASFETKTELGRWTVAPSASHAQRSAWHATAGPTALKLAAPAEIALDVAASDLPADWSAYDRVTLDVYNPQLYPVVLGVRIEAAPPAPPAPPAASAAPRLFLLPVPPAPPAKPTLLVVPPKAPTTLTLVLSGPGAPEARGVRKLALSLKDRKRPDVLFLDNVRLVKDGTEEVPFVAPPDPPEPTWKPAASGRPRPPARPVIAVPTSAPSSLLQGLTGGRASPPPPKASPVAVPPAASPAPSGAPEEDEGEGEDEGGEPEKPEPPKP